MGTLPQTASERLSHMRTVKKRICCSKVTWPHRVMLIVGVGVSSCTMVAGRPGTSSQRLSPMRLRVAPGKPHESAFF